MTTGDSTNIQGTLDNSAASTSFRFEFFANDACNDPPPDDFGEGQFFLGFTNGTTNTDGNATFNFTSSAPVSAGKVITSTATRLDSTGNPTDTSGFSQCLQVTGSTTTADLSLTKSASPNPVAPGSDITYTITVANAGANSTGNVTVADTLPSETTFVSCAATGGGVCGGIGNTRRITFDTLGIGAQAVITLVARVNASVPSGTVISNTASVASGVTPDPNSANDSATATTTAAAATVSISGTIRYCPATTLLSVPNANLALTGDATANTSTNADGVYQFTNLSSGSYVVTPSKAGLPSGSTGIESPDIVAERRHALGITPLTGCRLLAGDSNGDTAVDAADIVPIRRFALGLGTGIANVGQWRFSPTNRTYVSITSDQTNQDYDALVIGDTTGDLTPSSPTTSPATSSSTTSSSTAASSIRAFASLFAPTAVATVSLPAANVSTPTVTTFTLPVTTSNIPLADNLVAFQGDFTFDPTVVSFQTPAVSKAGLTAGAIWNVNASLCPPLSTCNATQQTLRVIADSDGTIPLSGSGVLFNLNFVRVSTTPGESTALTWAAFPNDFRFFEGATFTRQAPGSTPPGSITIAGAPTATNGVVSGRITSPEGMPVSGAVVRLATRWTRPNTSCASNT